MQLELLHLWHEALSAQLATFAHQFRGAGGRVLLAADRAGFSVAAESCSYEGPLRLEVSLLQVVCGSGAGGQHMHELTLLTGLASALLWRVAAMKGL
jgi:hypothetical protein